MNLLRAPRHRSFYIALAFGVVAGLAALAAQPSAALGIAVNLFFLVYLGLTWRNIRKLNPGFLRQHAAEQDAPAPYILFVMLAAVAVSAGSLFALLMGGGGFSLRLSLSIVSVVLGWFAVHTMWAMHYAFEYYQVPEASGDQRSGEIVGGLDFPGGDDPDGTAFVYFAYVIGMTAQTSDTAVTSNAMRRLVTVHGAFSFFFNTVLVAAAVNIVVTLAH